MMKTVGVWMKPMKRIGKKNGITSISNRWSCARLVDSLSAGDRGHIVSFRERRSILESCRSWRTCKTSCVLLSLDYDLPPPLTPTPIPTPTLNSAILKVFIEGSSRVFLLSSSFLSSVYSPRECHALEYSSETGTIMMLACLYTWKKTLGI